MGNAVVRTLIMVNQDATAWFNASLIGARPSSDRTLPPLSYRLLRRIELEQAVVRDGRESEAFVDVSS
jgi:hypothetical protein